MSNNQQYKQLEKEIRAGYANFCREIETLEKKNSAILKRFSKELDKIRLEKLKNQFND